MQESDYRAIALFFRITLIDPNQTRLASIRTLRSLRSKGIGVGGALRAPAIEILIQNWVHFGSSRSFSQEDSTAPVDFPLQSIPLRSWQRFLDEAPREELLVYILCEVLGAPLSEVAHALKMSEGSVRHRRSRSLYRLADIVMPVEESSHVQV